MNSQFYPRDRRNSGLEKYHLLTADVIGISWQFHKKRVQTGNLGFSMMGSEKFDVNKVVQYQTDVMKRESVDIIRSFSGGALNSLVISLQQFMGANTDGAIPDESKFPIPDSCKLLINDRVKELIKKAQQEGELSSGFASGENYNVLTTIGAGVATGTEIIPQLDAIFGEEFKPQYGLLLSKVLLDNSLEANRGVMADGNYELLDSQTGINREMLKILGLGEAIGCPAGIPVSKQTREFLRENGFAPTARTMLEDFALLFHQEFKPIRDWYNLEGNRQKITEGNRELLDGAVWEMVKAIKVYPESSELQCPYSKERGF